MAKIPKKRFTPTGEFCALHVFPAHETAGGIVIPENARDTVVSPRAQVIAVGPEVKQVKEGDLVVTFNGTMAGTIVIDGDKYLMLREEHIAGVLINPTHTKE